MNGNLWEEEAEELYELEINFTEDEIKKAVWDLGPDKSPDSDGFPMFFFQEFSGTVGGDIIEFVRSFGDGRAMIDRINYSLIVLIPKKENLTVSGDFRPIALLQSAFKIISKVLANRLAPLMNKLVREYQS